jgi:hypothetical protein
MVSRDAHYLITQIFRLCIEISTRELHNNMQKAEITIVKGEKRKELEAFLKQRVGLFDYHLGDLDDFFFPHCKWIILWNENTITDLVLCYEPSSSSIPTILAFSLGPITIASRTDSE